MRLNSQGSDSQNEKPFLSNHKSIYSVEWAIARLFGLRLRRWHEWRCNILSWQCSRHSLFSISWRVSSAIRTHLFSAKIAPSKYTNHFEWTMQSFILILRQQGNCIYRVGEQRHNSTTIQFLVEEAFRKWRATTTRLFRPGESN